MSLALLRVEGDRAVSVILDGREETPAHDSAALELVRLTELAPAGFVAWLDRRLEGRVSDPSGWPALLRNDLEILHAGGANRVVPSLGFVDFDSPWLLDGPQDRRFATWLISPAAGVARCAALRAVGIEPAGWGFGAALFDLGRRGVAEGLCPVAEPALLLGGPPPAARALHPFEVARLIRRGYGRRWVGFWLLGNLLAHRRLPLAAATRGWVAVAAPQPDRQALRDLRPILPQGAAAVDVLIPTLGRPEHLQALLKDLAAQSLPPQRVIVVEQGSTSPELVEENWPFELRKLALPKIGVCRARNAGLAEVEGDWVLLLDDDVRLRPRLIERLVQVARGYGVDAVTARVHLPHQDPGEPLLPRPWPVFSSGGALVSARALEDSGGFDERLEGGFGEDYEIGVRLRLQGASVLCDGAEPILHLKAEIGGFRSPLPLPWEGDPLPPRPSPMVLYSRRKHLTPEMREGYRLYFTLTQLAGTPLWRWPRKLHRMTRQWERSEHWAAQLLEHR